MSDMTISSAQNTPSGSSPTALQGLFGNTPFSGSFLDMIMAAFAPTSSMAGLAAPSNTTNSDDDLMGMQAESDLSDPSDDLLLTPSLLHPDLLMILQNQVVANTNQKEIGLDILKSAQENFGQLPLSDQNSIGNQKDFLSSINNILSQIKDAFHLDQDQIGKDTAVLIPSMAKQENITSSNAFHQSMITEQDDSDLTDAEMKDIAQSLNEIEPESNITSDANSKKIDIKNNTLPTHIKEYTPPHLDVEANAGYNGNIIFQPSMAQTRASDSMTNPALKGMGISDGKNIIFSDPSADITFIDQTTRSYPQIQIQGNGQNNNASITGTSHAPSPSHIVAMNLMGMAGQKDAQSLSFQMTPPELGKIQIKMTYSKDKNIKADIFVEKQDTLDLLQKDTKTLEDIMRDNGISTNSGSLNFSLASQNQFSDFFGNQNEPAYSTSISSDVRNADTDQITRSDEIWFTDLNTGRVRYNIYA